MVLPSFSDPRLHLASVIISIHILGQIGLGFRVSVPQILAAILTCFVIELIWTFRRSQQVVWPASAMLTGSGVALIFRVLGTERGDHWSWRGWYLFSLVAGFSLISKYVVRYRDAHVFNPSNVGLVVAFLVLGSTRVEPLDFWWAPLRGWMVLAYLIILVGGLVITARLRLLAMAATFWVVLAVGLGVLASSGHCMTTAWALQPVCGAHFWQAIVTSPELLVFLFFMITDPKTIPVGRVARVAFAAALALISTLLIAPQTTEFGAKVGLLAGLVVMSPLRLFLDRGLKESPEQRRLGAVVARLTTAGGLDLRPLAIFSRGALLGSLVVVLGVGIVAAGAPARQAAQAGQLVEAPTVTVEIDPATLPTVGVEDDVLRLNLDIGNAADLAMSLAENLKIEGEAMRTADTSLLRAADTGERLLEMESRIQAAATQRKLVVSNYSFDSLQLRVLFIDGSQGGASLGLETTAIVDEITYNGEGVEQSRTSFPKTATFVLRQGTGDRWLIASELT